MPHRHKDSAPRASAFAAGLGPRLGLALVAAAVLWLCVFWALAR
ncbi:MAG: hypothetical protein U0942_02115 [Parvibaculum sp.]|nr:hypothetical protein [Parvibaculum sp.]MDZ4380117.1 hypothetical protein [Parvibaculum sp.]